MNETGYEIIGTRDWGDGPAEVVFVVNGESYALEADKTEQFANDLLAALEGETDA